MRVELGQRQPSLPMMIRWADALKTRMDMFREDDVYEGEDKPAGWKDNAKYIWPPNSAA